MKTININEHIWNIWNIGKENNVDIGVAKDMFIANLEQRAAVYHGADELDYAALGAAWAELGDGDKTKQRETYRQITAVTEAGGRYKDLTAARRADDRETFEGIVAEAVAALEAPAEGEAE